MKISVVVAVVVAVMTLPILATEPQPNTHEEAAMELLAIMDVEHTMLASASAITDAMVQQNMMLAPYRDVIIEWAEEIMTWETFGPHYVTMYTESFTESELRELTAFYKTPTGQKALALMPEMMRRGAMFGAEVAQEHIQELETMVRERDAELEQLAITPQGDATEPD